MDLDVPSLNNILLVVSMNACAGSYYLNCDFVWEPSDDMDYRGYEEFVWVVMLGGHEPYVVV